MRFKNNNSSLAVVGMITGLAVGAALAVLFAPKKGKSTRSAIADKLNELTCCIKAKKAAAVGEQSVEDLRAHSREVADHLTAAAEEHVDPSAQTIKNNGPKLRQPPEESKG